MQNEDCLPHHWGNYTFPKDTSHREKNQALTHAMEIKTCHQYCKIDFPIYTALFYKGTDQHITY